MFHLREDGSVVMAKRLPRGQQTRELILDRALHEFAARGYQQVTVEEIAAAAGVTKGAVYHWFHDKDDLGRELQHRLYERLSNAALSAFDLDTDLVSGMSRAFQAWLGALGDLGEARFFLRDAWVIPALDEAGRADHEDAVEVVESVLRRAVEHGDMVALDPAATARVLMGAWAEATLHVLRTGDRDATVAVVEALLEALRPGRVAPPRATAANDRTAPDRPSSRKARR